MLPPRLSRSPRRVRSCVGSTAPLFPFPVVRLSGTIVKDGIRVRRLTVDAPAGSPHRGQVQGVRLSLPMAPLLPSLRRRGARRAGDSPQRPLPARTCERAGLRYADGLNRPLHALQDPRRQTAGARRPVSGVGVETPDPVSGVTRVTVRARKGRTGERSIAAGYAPSMCGRAGMLCLFLASRRGSSLQRDRQRPRLPAGREGVIHLVATGAADRATGHVHLHVDGRSRQRDQGAALGSRRRRPVRRPHGPEGDHVLLDARAATW